MPQDFCYQHLLGIVAATLGKKIFLPENLGRLRVDRFAFGWMKKNIAF
jgi:hypothetical protein